MYRFRISDKKQRKQSVLQCQILAQMCQIYFQLGDMLFLKNYAYCPLFLLTLYKVYRILRETHSLRCRRVDRNTDGIIFSKTKY